jgi:hypothetical protein
MIQGKLPQHRPHIDAQFGLNSFNGAMDLRTLKSWVAVNSRKRLDPNTPTELSKLHIGGKRVQTFRSATGLDDDGILLLIRIIADELGADDGVRKFDAFTLGYILSEYRNPALVKAVLLEEIEGRVGRDVRAGVTGSLPALTFPLVMYAPDGSFIRGIKWERCTLEGFAANMEPLGALDGGCVKQGDSTIFVGSTIDADGLMRIMGSASWVYITVGGRSEPFTEASYFMDAIRSSLGYSLAYFTLRGPTAVPFWVGNIPALVVSMMGQLHRKVILMNGNGAGDGMPYNLAPRLSELRDQLDEDSIHLKLLYVYVYLLNHCALPQSLSRVGIKTAEALMSSISHIEPDFTSLKPLYIRGWVAPEPYLISTYSDPLTRPPTS